MGNRGALFFSLYMASIFLVAIGIEVGDAHMFWSSPMQAIHTTSKKDAPWITVFVHGIFTVATHLNVKNIYLFMRDDILNTIYARTVHYMRQNPFFYENSGMGPLGLHPIDTLNLGRQMTANAIAHIYNEMLRTVGLPHEQNYYYTYGWSGLFSLSQRYEEAEQLLLGLHALVQQHQERGINPKIRIIGYSHGGNVSLNIAAIQRDKYPAMDIQIDELILIGMPVQMKTDTLTLSPIFKRIYHFYSRLDRIQQLDIFSMNRIFSARRFENRHDFQIPSKVTQIQIKCSRIRKNKRQRQLHIHAQDYKRMINKSGQRRNMRDASPGHIELWFFGWTLDNYRSTFPLEPLPVLAFIPYIIAELNKLDGQLLNQNPIIFDMRPDIGMSIIRQRGTVLSTAVPFVDRERLDPLHRIARSIKADDYNEQTYQRHLEHACNQAFFDHKEHRKNKRRPSRRVRRRHKPRSHHMHSGYTLV